MRKVILLLILLVLFSSSVASAALVDNGDGTVTDTGSGLMWQKATTPVTYTWQNAFSYCENLSLAGYSDWRLPNRNELQSLADYSRYNPAIDPLLVPHTVSSSYWSSTTSTDSAGGAWRVYFYDGRDGSGSKSSSYYVRAVRAGQSGALGSLMISNISSPPQVGTSFDITVTAINNDGRIDTSFNGNASLSASVPMSPDTPVTLQNGVWTGPIKLLAEGVNLTVNAAGTDRSGTSNLFSTSGSANGNLGGQVKDNQ